jgi:hypothetical protein
MWYRGKDETGTARAGQASRAVPVAIEVSHLTKVFGGARRRVRRLVQCRER